MLGNINNTVIFEENNGDTYFKSLSKRKYKIDGISNLNYQNKEIDIYNYKFEDEKRFSKQSQNQKSLSNSNSEVKFPGQKIYNLNFTIGEFIMQLNPTFNNQAYQRYSNSGFKNAGFDGFTLIQAKDVFEDYKISGGIKGPVQLNLSLIHISEPTRPY